MKYTVIGNLTYSIRACQDKECS